MNWFWQKRRRKMRDPSWRCLLKSRWPVWQSTKDSRDGTLKPYSGNTAAVACSKTDGAKIWASRASIYLVRNLNILSASPVGNSQRDSYWISISWKTEGKLTNYLKDWSKKSFTYKHRVSRRQTIWPKTTKWDDRAQSSTNLHCQNKRPSLASHQS